MSDQKEKNIDYYNDFILNALDLYMRYIVYIYM